METQYTQVESYLKSQLSPEDWKIVQNMQLNLETKAWANMGVDFVNFEKRTRKETPFLLAQLREYQYPKVFDACLGTGATSLGLQLADPNMIIIANEIDSDLEKIAREEIKKIIGKEDFPIKHHDWREGIVNGPRDRYNVVLCLGNALTYIFKREEQLAAVRNFRKALRPDGKLIIDERNYAEHFLAPNAEFKCSGEVVYCGTDKVRPQPIYISSSMIIMEYRHLSTDKKAHLVLYPFKKGEMKSLLQMAGFQEIQTFGDYKEQFDPKEPEFFTYVARK